MAFKFKVYLVHKVYIRNRNSISDFVFFINLFNKISSRNQLKIKVQKMVLQNSLSFRQKIKLYQNQVEKFIKKCFMFYDHKRRFISQNIKINFLNLTTHYMGLPHWMANHYSYDWTKYQVQSDLDVYFKPKNNCLLNCTLVYRPYSIPYQIENNSSTIFES